MSEVSTAGEQLLSMAHTFHARALLRSPTQTDAMRLQWLAVEHHLYTHLMHQPIVFRLLSVDITRGLLVRSFYLLATLTFSLRRFVTGAPDES
jgi:hypothetical protein